MSGIAGIIRLDGAPADATGIEAMLRQMRRRGQDRQNTRCAGSASFGHALLATTLESLVDTQPWLHAQTGCIVVSDCRLDNRPQLLRSLGIEQAADEVGDGELLHAAWQRWADDCVDQLRGDFAFAIWNPRERELFLARDPMGVRPLAFHFDPGRLFVFASVADVVVAQGEVPRDFNEGRIADALIGETEGIDQTCTFYSAIQRMPPAHWMRLRDGKLTSQRYWRPVGDRPDGLPKSNAEWVEAQREQLDRAVRLRLRSHRPVGSMLSGGLDSSSVVALASAACAADGSPPLPIFSATHSADPDCLETRHIRAVIEHVRCDPTLIDLADFKHSSSTDKLWWRLVDEPFDASLSLVAALYQAAAAKGVASLMDGVPADNLYVTGRYPQYLFDQGHYRQAWNAALTQWQIEGTRLPRLHAMRVMVGCLAPKKIHDWRDRQVAERNYRQFLGASLINKAFAERVGLRDRYHRYHRTIAGAHQWHPTEQALSSMAASYITAGLERYNRVASLFGIEPRPPYADRDLIEFQAWMPLALRTRNGHPKWVLRQAIAKDLPASVIWRRDKEHIGWRFSQTAMETSRHDFSLDSESVSAWLDRRRLNQAMPMPASSSSDGMLAALYVLAWVQERSADRLDEAAPC